MAQGKPPAKLPTKYAKKLNNLRGIPPSAISTLSSISKIELKNKCGIRAEKMIAINC